MNSFVKPLLTDLYQITMCYAYFKADKHEDFAVFDLFFRRNPFNGAFTIFAGLSDCLKFVEDFKFTQNDIEFLKKVLSKDVESEFYEYLLSIDCSKVKINAIPEGSVVFPRIPLIVVEGPLAVCQLLESTLLNLVNYASLMTTNAARCRLAAGTDKELLEFGLRRAQGPDGAVSASKYAYIGGFDGTSNVLAGRLFDIPLGGTHAHSFVSSFEVNDLRDKKILRDKMDGEKIVDFTSLALEFRQSLVDRIMKKIIVEEVNHGEFAAFISYAVSFPNSFWALVDTYDVLKSGIVNFCACALALYSLSYQPMGVRIDSGDLAYLSKETRRVFQLVANEFNIPSFARLKIVVSNDLNEDTILSLAEQNHEADCFGVGTHLVTCQKQPALGCVYKLVELNGTARIKLGEDVAKVTIPGRKRCYRLFGKDGCAINDLLTLHDDEMSMPGKAFLCRHPFHAAKRAYVNPTSIVSLHQLCWDQGKFTNGRTDSLLEVRQRVQDSLKTIRKDIKRPLNPTPYKVSVNERLFDFLHQIWQANEPIGRLE